MSAWFADFLAALRFDSGYPLLFNTLLFAAVFTALLLLHALLGRRPLARVVLLLAFSLLFYYKASGWLVLLMAGTALVDWAVVLWMARQPEGWRRNGLLAVSLLLNLGLLGWFKYANFFGETYWALFHADQPYNALDILLPVGISFYTFRTLSYMLDVHREVLEPEPSFLHYWLYVGFFANTLAGPITRAGAFLPQLRQAYTPTAAQAGEAFFLFVTGLFKKVVVADYLAVNLVDRVFDAPGAFTGFENLMAVLGYAVQLYYDFSGYTDMALGLALLLGIRLQGNFHEPFKATSVSDFWRRWHITLSTWFNDYVFLPLSFAWRSARRVGIMLAVLLTFLLSGLWHGAAWTFVLWGAAHGLAIAVETALAPWRRRMAQRVPRAWLPFSWLLTFAFLCGTYVLFRAPSLASALTMYQQLTDNLHLELAPQWFALYSGPAWMLLAGFGLHFVPTGWKHGLKTGFVRLPWPAQALACALLVVAAYQARTAGLQPFIYLQF